MTDACIQIDAVGKRYGQLNAVTGVDLCLKAGECVALVGHNGAGKSRLSKLILGLLQPDGAV